MLICIHDWLVFFSICFLFKKKEKKGEKKKTKKKEAKEEWN
jgi:hypothetical protein